MKSKKGPVSLIVIGGILALGPVWGLLGTMIGMVLSFNTLAQEQAGAAKDAHLANNIALSLYSTLAGFIMSPVGIGLLIWGIVWLSRVRKLNRQTLPPPLNQ